MIQSILWFFGLFVVVILPRRIAAKFAWTTLYLLVTLAALTYAAPAKQGQCHTCKCESRASECVSICGRKDMCVVECSHDCQMKKHGIKKCPAKNRTRRPSGRES